MTEETSKWYVYRPLVIIAILTIIFVVLIYAISSGNWIFFSPLRALEVITEGINMTVDTVGIILFLLGLVLYFATKRKHAIFLFLSGIGAGMLVATIWLAVQMELIFNRFLP